MDKNIDADAFGKNAKKLTVKYPKKMLKKYQKWLMKKGVSSLVVSQ